MKDNRKQLGLYGEHIAAQFLSKHGYQIIEKNFRCSLGEIDIIAEHNGCIVFIEVRTKKKLTFGTPEESITTAKKDKLISLVETYLQMKEKSDSPWRIDMVAIEIHKDNSIFRIELVENITC